MKTTTLKDVAKVTGFSPSTISKVVNNKPGVNPSTKLIVENAIKTLKYVPSLSARELRGAEPQKTISVIIFGETDFQYPPDTKILLGILEKSTELNLRLKVKQIKGSYRQQLDSAIFEQAGSHCILMEDVPMELSLRLKEINCKCVAIGNVNIKGIIPNIRIDGRLAGFRAMEFLYLHQYKRIILPHGLFETENIKTPLLYELSLGYMDAIRKFKIELVNFEDFDKNDKTDRTCFLCSDDPSALKEYYNLQSQCIKIPEDIGVMGMGNSLPPSLLPCTLTTVDFQFKEIGMKAVELLNCHEDVICEPLILEPTIIPGETI